MFYCVLKQQKKASVTNVKESRTLGIEFSKICIIIHKSLTVACEVMHFFSVKEPFVVPSFIYS
jgi:hypothetical protein